MSYVVPGHEFMPQFQKSQLMAAHSSEKPWDGTKTVARWHPQGLKAPTGLWSYLKEILSAHSIPFTISDERPAPIPSPGYSTPSLILRPYQNEAIGEGLKRQRGVMRASTGSGKTEMLVSMISQAGCFPAIYYVTSCDLLRQAYDRFRSYLLYNGQPAEIGRVGAGYCEVKPITIATVQSAQLALEGKFTKYSYDDFSATDTTKLDERQKAMVRQMVHDAQFVYCDEAHHVSSDTIQSILNNSHKARFRIGGSASPWRDDGLDILIEACFGRRFCDITASFLINQGFLVKPEITFNHFQQHLGPTKTYQAHYTKYVVENEARNKFIAQRAIHHMDQQRPTIVLVKWVNHAEKLAALIPNSEILTASGDSKKSPVKRQEALDLMRDRKLMCIIATSLLDEGVDVPAASAGIFAGGGKSSTRALQRVGRFIRKDKRYPKDCAWVEEFDDHTRYLHHHAVERRRILQTEPAFEIRDNRSTMML